MGEVHARPYASTTALSADLVNGNPAENRAIAPKPLIAGNNLIAGSHPLPIS
jgi:hypothetical protein